MSFDAPSVSIITNLFFSATVSAVRLLALAYGPSRKSILSSLISFCVLVAVVLALLSSS